MMEGTTTVGEVCKCPHHKMVPIAVILIGLTFLLATFGVISDYARNIIWPILLIAGAITKMNGKNCKCCMRDK